MDRKPPEVLEAHYKALCEAPSDISEHLPLLREIAEECEHVTEMGMRSAVSTVAFLAAQPATLISWDMNPAAIVSQRVADLLAIAGRTSFQPRVGDTLKIAPIEETDLLFIDTLHTGAQLLAELKRHADPTAKRVRKYLVFHDTATFGHVGEDGKEPGLRAAIRFFQRNHAFPQWALVEDRQNNNGLVVLRNAAL
jgi:cephalosporin hydroxylase